MLLIAAVAVGGLALEATPRTASASVSTKGRHGVVGKKQAKQCDVAAIKATYNAVLNTTNGLTAPQKEAYIQDMDTNAALRTQFERISATADSAKEITPVINKVRCSKNGKTASVDYDLSLNGTVAKSLVTRPGKAVFQSGSWKFGASTFCSWQVLQDPNVGATGPCADIVHGTMPK